MVISMVQVQSTHPKANALIFTTNEGGKSGHGRWVKTKRQKKCPLDGCNDRIFSRPSRMGHDPFTLHTIIMVELIVPDENRTEGAHIYNREKYLNLTKELGDASDKVVVMFVEI